MKRLWTLALLALVVPAGLNAQSLLGSEGLGLYTKPIDARARALGGVTAGTLTPGIIPGQPTAALDLLFPGLAFTAQPTWGDFDLDGETGDFQATRFPIAGVSYPVGTRGVVTAVVSSHFDQRWSLTREGTTMIGDEEVAIQDDFNSDGGIAKVEVGYARRMAASLDIGVSAGLYRGRVTRTFTRQFDTIAVDNPIAPFINGGRWGYFGPTATLDVSWDPVSIVRLGGTVTWAGTLDAEPTSDTEGQAREIDLPLEFSAGASVVLSPSLSWTAGIETANWASLGDDDFNEAATGRVLTFGTGLEWAATNFWSGPFPLRLGYRRSELPFGFEGASAKETAFTGGFQAVLAEVQGVPRATLDFALEFGSRESGALSESFERATLTFRLSGF